MTRRERRAAERLEERRERLEQAAAPPKKGGGHCCNLADDGHILHDMKEYKIRLTAAQDADIEQFQRQFDFLRDMNKETALQWLVNCKLLSLDFVRERDKLKPGEDHIKSGRLLNTPVEYIDNLFKGEK